MIPACNSVNAWTNFMIICSKLKALSQVDIITYPLVNSYQLYVCGDGTENIHLIYDVLSVYN